MDQELVDVFVARQPIFDRQRRVAGYELLYRSGAVDHFDGGDLDVASAVNLERSLLGFGLGTLAGDRDVWVNASRLMLVNDHWALLPAERTVIEVLEHVAPDDEVVAALRRLRRDGYRVALDDFEDKPESETLLALADFVKVDFRAHDERARRRLAHRLLKMDLTLVAEKVETHEEFEHARDTGYTLFQGYFFRRPELMRTRDLGPNRVSYLRLLKEIHADQMDFAVVEGIISQDVAMSIKLLRFLHSASFGWTHEVTSVHQAILLLGERALRRWAALVAVFGLSRGKPTELVVTALTRARFAELLAPRVGFAGRELDLFLTGLLSVVDALTDRPLAEALDGLVLPESIRAALLANAPPFGDTLRLVLACERGDWDAADELLATLGASESDAAAAYTSAVLWAEDHAQP